MERTPSAPLEKPGTSAIGLVMAISGHAGGGHFPRVDPKNCRRPRMRIFVLSVAAIEDRWRAVDSIDSLPSARAVLFDTTPRQLVQIAGKRLHRRLSRAHDPSSPTGPGVFKIDWALSAPIPWTYPECLQKLRCTSGLPLKK